MNYTEWWYTDTGYRCKCVFCDCNQS